MSTRPKVPTIAEIRESVAKGLNSDLIADLPRMTTIRIHANGQERVPLFMISSACRFLSGPVEEHGSDTERLTRASERFCPALDAVLEGIDNGVGPADMYTLLDGFVSASAGANRALAIGEGSAQPASSHP